MNAFQILDENNKPISIGNLDRQACELWNKEIHEKQYAYPQHKPESFPTDEYKSSWDFYSSLTNWYDKIGWIIADKECEDWDKLIEIIMEPFLKIENITESDILEIRNEWVPIAGYIKLIEFWKSQNYKPKCIKDER
jgi:hypothetical protein